MKTINIQDDNFISNFIKYRHLLTQLIIRNIKLKYRRSVLGIFWSFLEPLLSMIVLTIIFSTFFIKSIPNFPVYYLTGVLIFTFFATGSSAAMRSMISNAGTIKTVYVPKYLFPLANVLSSFVTFLLSLIVLFIVMIATNVQFTVYIIFATLPLYLFVIFVIGIGLIMATANVFFRDLQHLYGVFLTMLMYAMPIFYPAEIVPENFRFIQTYNPIYAVISCVRSTFMYGKLYDPGLLLFIAISAVIAISLGIFLFNRYQNRFILYI